MLLDASQAFDRVNITKRFNMLIENGLSPVVVPLLITLYVKQVMGVKWKSRKGNFVTVTHRVKQGSIISPALFAMYFEKYREGNEKQSLYKKGVALLVLIQKKSYKRELMSMRDTLLVSYQDKIHTDQMISYLCVN